MGREVKRVALDFQWPLNMIWKGFMCPYRSQKCTVCDGSGLNPETKQINDDWYDFAVTGRKWCNNITQDEVDALIAKGRLNDFTSRFVRGTGWVKIDPPPTITAYQVNTWTQTIRMGHDAINRCICVETRAKRLGVFGQCPVCEGDGVIWFNAKIKALSELWYYEERYEPPSGDGWQVWETVSEGSPISPVFPDAYSMVSWLVSGGYSREAAESFAQKGWVMSGVIKDGKYLKDIEPSIA